MIDLKKSVASGTRRIPFILTAFLLLFIGSSQAGPVQGAACIAPPSDMGGWWPGDDNPNDITSFANTGTLMNGATYAPGMVASAFSLPGQRLCQRA